MVGDKMVALAKYLESKNIFKPHRFDYFLGDATLYPASKRLGNDQHVVTRVQYPAVFYIENFKYSADLIPVLVTTWLADHDCERVRLNLPMPTFTPEQLAECDSKLVNIEFEVEFQEDIIIVPDPQGLIDYLGNTYSVGSAVIDQVEELSTVEQRQ